MLPLQVKARQGLNEQINTIASSVLTIEPKHDGGQVSPQSISAATSSAGGGLPPQLSSTQLLQEEQPFGDTADAEGLFDVPLTTPGSQDCTSTNYGSGVVAGVIIPGGPASAAVLAKENAALKARLQVVEEAATDALGELQDLKDDVHAHKEARQAAEQQVRPNLGGL